MTSHHHDAGGAALPVCPPMARKPPTVEMPPNQFEPWITVQENYRNRTGITLDLQAVMTAAADANFILCADRRIKQR